MHKWVKEPLVHFLIGGALLFAFFAWQGEPADPASRKITVDGQVLTGIALGFEQQMGRAPTDAELDALIERFVREEVLYREALRLGLDQDDAVVRRRLAQKMDLIAAAQAEAQEPSEEKLNQWLAEHPERFASQARYSFEQLWFDDRESATRAHKELTSKSNPADFASTIDLPVSVSGMARGELADRFGQQFLSELDQLEPDENWQGPIPSGLGWHVVRLTQVQATALPPLADIRDEVTRDWRSATAASRKQQAYQLLREAYTIEIER